ncbi:actin depolymerizing factor [Imleria badia]|nr:actin depolymerizing factor [Imleria badia]
MASGVSVADNCITTFKELKLGKKIKYIVYNLSSDLTQIVVAKSSEEPDYDKFLADLPEKECRWAVYDFAFEKDSAKRNKLCFISWSPDEAKIKSKMLFASSRDALRRSLDGIALEIQGTDPTEVSYETVHTKASSGAR